MTEPVTRATVPVSGALRDALEVIDGSGLEIALAVDDAGRLIGVLTDGDIRRLLLKGVGLDSPLAPHTQRSFTHVGPTVGRSEVLDLMRALAISQIPILDAHGALIGLHTLHSIVGATARPHAAVVMAGGRGERLRPLTDEIPKPMLKVAGRPILERMVLHLVGFGIRTIHVAVNYKADVIERHFGDGSAFGCSIDYLREETPLGTGGALSLLPSVPDYPLLVLNGDLLTQVDLGSLLAFHEQGGHRATIGTCEYAHTVPLGVIELDGQRVVRMREKPTEVWQANAGIYVLDPALVRRVPPGTYYGLPALIEECLDRGESVGAFRVTDDWLDLGHHDELKRARGQE